MARYMSNDATKLYRVVVLSKNLRDPLALARKTIYGPYEYKRSAGYVKSYMTTGWGRNNIVDSWIEESEPVWVKSD
jgi:hypothetical protein